MGRCAASEGKRTGFCSTDRSSESASPENAYDEAEARVPDEGEEL